MAQRKIIKHIAEYIDFLKHHNVSVDNAFLFGSYSKGNQNAESDIDVLLVLNDFDKFNDELFGRVWRLTKEFDGKIEPLIISRKKFIEDDVSPILISIRRNAVAIL